uniref:Uncharacterized protein n=1 Tax=Noccaea caerulescens TaxID=107243 RepID=A0A1J3E643_NOCCA
MIWIEASLSGLIGSVLVLTCGDCGNFSRLLIGSFPIEFKDHDLGENNGGDNDRLLMTKRFEKIGYYGFKSVLLCGFGKEELRLMGFAITVSNRWRYICQISVMIGSGRNIRSVQSRSGSPNEKGNKIYCFVLFFLSYLVHEDHSRSNQIMVPPYFEPANNYEWDDLLTIVLLPFDQIGLIGFDWVVMNADFVFRIWMGFALVLMGSQDWDNIGDFQKENFGLQDWERGLQLNEHQLYMAWRSNALRVGGYQALLEGIWRS